MHTRYNDFWVYMAAEAYEETRRRREEAEERFRELPYLGGDAMPRVSEEYGGSFLKAADLQGRTVPCVIDRVTKEEFRDGELKWVVSFKGKDKRLVLNKTNADLIALQHGDEMDQWAGRTIKLYPTKTQMAGQTMDCIRVKDEAPEAAGDDEIPF
jgi:hypothetical protein